MVYTYRVKFDDSVEFVWDIGNTDKNWLKHQVSNTECEEVFFDSEKIVLKDALHSVIEERFIIIGKTKKKRLLFVAYTIRNTKVRIISARDTDKRERKIYEKNA